MTVCRLVGSLNRSKPETQTNEFDTTTTEFRAIYVNFSERKQRGKGLVALAHKLLRVVYMRIKTDDANRSWQQKKTPAKGIAEESHKIKKSLPSL